MPNYIPDPNNAKKQVPATKGNEHFDRFASPQTGSFTKTPNYILVTGTPANDLGFFFGSSASFASKVVSEGAVSAFSSSLTGSQHYANFGRPSAGTQINIHPIAWSGSLADSTAKTVTFVYKGGLDGQGRP